MQNNFIVSHGNLYLHLHCKKQKIKEDYSAVRSHLHLNL